MIRIFGGHPRLFLQGRRRFLEKLEPTSTRVLSYSATNLLRQNRRSDGNESNKRRKVDSPLLLSHLHVALIRCCRQSSWIPIYLYRRERRAKPTARCDVAIFRKAVGTAPDVAHLVR